MSKAALALERRRDRDPRDDRADVDDSWGEDARCELERVVPVVI